MHVYASSSPCYCVFLHFFRSVLVRNSAILSWDSHAKDLFFFLDHHCQSSLVSRLIEWVIAVIHKSSFCLPVTSLRSLYYNLVYPYLVYCTSFRMGFDVSHKLESYCSTSEKKIFELFPRSHLMLTLILNSNVCKYWHYLKFTFFKLESSCILIK